MKRNSFTILLLSIFLLVFNSIQGQDKDSKSVAQITGLAHGTYNFGCPPQEPSIYYAGTFKGTVDGGNANFYCIDLNHYLEFNADYIDAQPTSSKITHILNNYYPYKELPYDGALDENKEAAAVQLAIWHFSDGLIAENCDNEELRDRALEIIADADANAGDVQPIETLVINIPEDQDFVTGQPIEFYVETYNEVDSPVEGAEITLSVSDGTLSETTVVTNATGVAGPITLTPNSQNCTITAHGVITIPHGTEYHHAANPDGKQKLVIAKPVIAEKEVSADVEWFDDIDLAIEKTCSTITVKDGDHVTYQITVSNSGQTTATGVQALDLLPDILTFVSADGDYDPDTGVWNVGDVYGNGEATLEIIAAVNYSNDGAMTYSFGPAEDYNLFVLKDLNQPSADTEGKVAVGKNAVLSNYSVGDKLPENSGDVLIVGRKLTFYSGRVYNGNVVFGSFIDTTHWNLADGTIRKDNVIDFDAAKNYLKDLSNQISVLEETGTDTLEWSHLKLVGTEPELNVFYVDGDEVSGATEFTVDIPEGSVGLINVEGDNIDWSGDFQVTGASNENLILNFHKTKHIKISNIDIRASILAPWASLDFPSGIVSGQVICKNMTGSGQFNYVKFTGTLSRDITITNYASIIEVNQPDYNDLNNNSMNQVTADGITGIGYGGEENGLPTEYKLYQNYPNPFNPSATIAYDLPKDGFVELKVYNILGNEVATLVNENKSAGSYKINFNASELASGIYIYNIRANGFVASKKMILLK
ncbi:MAG: choice-of-anchor A family protein [Chlorobi bacterium]|nr:choice-of-anchor A family protein [Chlorobiota bacterium]